MYDTLIRGTHPYCFRSGEWATLSHIETVIRPDGEHRKCYAVVFEGGVSDLWPVEDDSYGYEFKVEVH